MIWNALQKLINENNTFLISSHVSQDGDCVGSQLSFYWYLKSLGKEVTIYNTDTLPSKFTFFDNSDCIGNTPPTEHFDVLCILDASNPSRTGWDGIDSCADAIIDIDHHRDNSRFGTVSIVDETAAATCQIIYQFFTDTKVDFPLSVANALYAGLLTDTGGFQFSNTDQRVLSIAADLVGRGADNAGIYKKLFATYSIAGLQLRSHIWGTLQFFANQKIAVMQMPLSLVDELGADPSDTEGMSNLAMTAEGVEVGVFMKYKANEIRFSLRSVGNVDVGQVAASLPGGGGHKCASGCTAFNTTPEDALEQIVKEITLQL